MLDWLYREVRVAAVSILGRIGVRRKASCRQDMPGRRISRGSLPLSVESGPTRSNVSETSLDETPIDAMLRGGDCFCTCHIRTPVDALCVHLPDTVLQLVSSLPQPGHGLLPHLVVGGGHDTMPDVDWPAGGLAALPSRHCGAAPPGCDHKQRVRDDPGH